MDGQNNQTQRVLLDNPAGFPCGNHGARISDLEADVKLLQANEAKTREVLQSIDGSLKVLTNQMRLLLWLLGVTGAAAIVYGVNKIMAVVWP